MSNNGHGIIESARHMNALLPISGLPDSVLAEIFDCYRELHPAEELIILQITHVCHAWRAVASSHGRLWTNIYVVCPDQVQHWLARSANCLLDVEADIIDDPGEPEDLRTSESDALCLVLEELPRIRTLQLPDIGFTKEQLSKSRWTKSSASSPFLQSLSVNASEKTYSEALDDSFCTTALFLNRDLPSLTYLSIVDSRFLSNNARFPQSLKNLEICNMDPAADWDHKDPNIASVILAVLGTLPSLESLRLTWIYDEDFVGPIPPAQQQVTLPHLRKLEVQTWYPPDMCTCLLTHLTFPSAAKIKLHAGHVDKLERKSFLESVAVKMDGRHSIGDICPLRSFFIGCEILDTTHVDMDGWCAAHPPESFAPGNNESDAHIVLFDASGDANVDVARSIHLACATLPLSKVESLTLRNVCLDIDSPTLTTISQNMPALQTLHIRNWSCQELWPECELHVASWDINGLFPNLKNIYLEDLWHCEFAEDETVGFWEFLVQFLTARQERCASIEKLTVRACEDVDADRRTLLQGLADKLIWEPTARASDSDTGCDH